MASQPPPESIVLDRFSGIRNTVARDRLSPEELELAINVDIDDSGQPRRRRGFALKDPNSWHSIRDIAGRVFGVKNGTLGIINADYSFVSLVFVGPERLSYTAIGPVVYYSSLTASGQITADNVVATWGAVADGGQWVSPVVTPTETLGAVFGKRIEAPPMATDIAAFNGRIYLLAGKYLWATELFQYNYIDPARNFLQFENEGTMLAARNDGLFVGTTDSLHFLKGSLSGGFQRQDISAVGVVPGSLVEMPTTDVHPNARSGPMPEGVAAVFLTRRGLSAGFDGGEVFDLTHGKVEFPVAVRAAAMYRQDSGMSSYVASTDSAGGPAANARIGDWCDAEIVRAGG